MGTRGTHIAKDWINKFSKGERTTPTTKIRRVSLSDDDDDGGA